MWLGKKKKNTLILESIQSIKIFSLYLWDKPRVGKTNSTFSLTTNEQKTQMKKPQWTWRVVISLQNSKLSSSTNSLYKSFPDLKKKIKIHCLSSIKWSILQSPMVPKIPGLTAPLTKVVCQNSCVYFCNVVRASVWKIIKITFSTISKHFLQRTVVYLKLLRN